MKQAIGLVLSSYKTGLSIYARVFDENGVQVGADIYDIFIEQGLGHYTHVYDGYPDDFYGTVSYYDVVDDTLLVSTEINPTSLSLEFIGGEDAGLRQRDILIYAGDTTNISWRSNTSSTATEIVLVIKYDMVDLVEDAMLVVSLTNGCETVLGQPSQDSSLATITFDSNFIYVIMKSELTVLFTSITGYQQYDLKHTSLLQGTKTKGIGNCSIVLGGSI